VRGRRRLTNRSWPAAETPLDACLSRPSRCGLAATGKTRGHRRGAGTFAESQHIPVGKRLMKNLLVSTILAAAAASSPRARAIRCRLPDQYPLPPWPPMVS
jgi:hypothetical protein